MQTPRIWYVNVFASDLARSVAFYRDALGLPLQFVNDGHGYAAFGTPGLRLGIARVDPSAPESASLLGRHTGVGFGVPDLEAAHRELVAKGVVFTMPPTRQPWGGTISTFTDPDANVFYLDQLHGD